MSDFQKYVAKVSSPFLVRLHALPRWVIPILMTFLLLVGLLANPNETWGFWIGFFGLMFIAVFLGWLLILSWMILVPTSRLLRILVIGLLLYASFSRFTSI
ncbi:MAG: DUF6703 family protein [Actinomycetes bacterium]